MHHPHNQVGPADIYRTAAAPLAPPSRAARLALVYLLDVMGSARRPGEVLEPLILGAIASASVARISEYPALDGAYATLDAPAPDALRRPIPMLALAESLRLPYETVRRRVHKLAAAGRCQLTPDGVVQPESAGNDPRHVAEAVERYERTRRLYFDLLAAGEPVARRTAAPGASLGPPQPPVRLVNRLVGDYCLRLADAMTRGAGDLLKGLILMEIARAGDERLDAAGFPAAEGRPPGATPRPVLPADLSRRLQVPAETMRRHITALSDMGLVIRRPAGVLLSPQGLEQSGFAQVAAANASNLRRLFDRLDRAGVLHRWDAEAAPPLAACA
jgi:DNA-binding transcriptional ArsR family regulator